MEKTPAKIAVIVGIIIIAYAAILALLFYQKTDPLEKPKGGNDKKPQEVLYMILSPHTYWQRVDGKWQNASDINVYSKHLFAAYNNNQAIGNYFFSYNDKWYLYDQNDDFYNYDPTSNIIAFYGKGTYEVIAFNETELNAEDTIIIETYLKDHNINLDLTNLLLKKITFNYTNNNNLSTIYVVSNAFSTEVDSSNTRFSFIFGYQNNKSIDIFNYQTESESIYSGCSPTVQNIIDLDKDGQIEVITSCAEFSDGEICQTLSRYQDGKFIILKDCE